MFRGLLRVASVLCVALLGSSFHENTAHLVSACGSCVPPQQSDVHSVSFNIDSSASGIQNQVSAAAASWNSAFQSAGASYRFTNSQSAAFTISVVSGACEAQDGSGFYGQTVYQSNYMYICVSALQQSNPNFLQRVITHEFGHLAGLGHGTCSADDTVMTVIQPADMTATSASLLGCADTAQMYSLYHPRDDDHDGYTMDNDCSFDPSFDGPSYDWVNPGISVNCGVQQDDNDKDCNGEIDSTQCGQSTPIVIDVAGDGVDLTSPDDGVLFDLVPNGKKELLAWTRGGSDDAWLVLDRNGNGIIDDGTELFGSYTPQPGSSGQERNGFAALEVFDRPEAGGNGDGWIDSNDAIFSELRLWQDRNHDGLSQPDELISLSAAGIARISLRFHESRREDRFGNMFRYVSRVGGGSGVRAYDVILVEKAFK